jgi:hypothetical protein
VEDANEEKKQEIRKIDEAIKDHEDSIREMVNI